MNKTQTNKSRLIVFIVKHNQITTMQEIVCIYKAIISIVIIILKIIIKWNEITKCL